QKGMRVVVQGNLRSRQYETREGEKRTVFEIQVDEVGPSLRYATAKVTRTQRQGGSSYGGQQGGPGGGPSDNDPWATPAQGQGAPQGGPAGGAPANDPWATPGVSSDEPPF
ncbi:MAG TPA: single-stranded DNA-binding protein, partial [Nocardioides sp.]|nr:single-stranded DNA-binding protein [Nocardioides sp.]